MKKFLQYFVLEFAIIFIVGLIGYRILNVPYNWLPLLSVSAVSGAVIAFAMWSLKKN